MGANKVHCGRCARGVCSLRFPGIGPLQLAIHVVQSRHAGEQKSHWDKTNKRHTNFTR